MNIILVNLRRLTNIINKFDKSHLNMNYLYKNLKNKYYSLDVVFSTKYT